jgi:hypothetical protein
VYYYEDKKMARYEAQLPPTNCYVTQLRQAMLLGNKKIVSHLQKEDVCSEPTGHIGGVYTGPGMAK